VSLSRECAAGSQKLLDRPRDGPVGRGAVALREPPVCPADPQGLPRRASFERNPYDTEKLSRFGGRGRKAQAFRRLPGVRAGQAMKSHRALARWSTGRLQSGNGEQQKSRRRGRKNASQAARASRSRSRVVNRQSPFRGGSRSSIAAAPQVLLAADRWLVQRSRNSSRRLRSPRAHQARKVGFQRQRSGCTVPLPGGA